MRRNREAHRANQMRRDGEPDPSLGQRPAHAPEAAALQYRQIAMNQARRRRRSGAPKIALLEQDDPQTPTGRIARDADTVQATADDREVIVSHETVVKE